MPALIKRAASLLLAVSASVMLAACGFQMRGTHDYPFKRLFVSGVPNPEMSMRLKRMIEGGSDTRVVSTPAEADAILSVSSSRSRGTLSLNVNGVALEYVLTDSIQYSLASKDGKLLVPPSSISVNRSMSYSDRYALAKEKEQDLLYRDMDNDIVDQLLRRLAVVRTLHPEETEVPAVNLRAPLPTPPL